MDALIWTFASLRSSVWCDTPQVPLVCYLWLMPEHWSDWVHAICNTRGSWLPGDPRGFRSRHHRIHNSGDYRTPPPAGEHHGLYRSAQSRAAPMIRLSQQEQVIVANAFAAKLTAMDLMPSTLAIDEIHMHCLVRVGTCDAKVLIGRAKQHASHAVHSLRPGRIWSQGCHVVRVRDASHWESVRRYILDHAHKGALVLDMNSV